MSSIAKDKVGIFNYTLTNEEGEVLDSSQGHPMPYLHGYSNIIPGLERQMEGKGAGDQFTATVPPAEAYGEYYEEANFAVNRQDMPPEQFDQMQVGAQVFGQAEDGTPVPLFVTKKEEAWVHFTHNHPLAGMTLTFQIEIVGVRDALPVELQDGHPHGVDGTQGQRQ